MLRAACRTLGCRPPPTPTASQVTTPIEVLEARARALVDGVANDPEGRYRLREEFYKRWGFADVYARSPEATDSSLDPFGFGTSELAFLRWEMRRGVLNPVGGADTGSPWWRAVNLQFLYLSELAGMIADAGLGASVDNIDLRYWLDYFAKPSGPAWYRAHNGCIVRAYLDQRELAYAEGVNEELLMNEVLYRLLFAEAMEMGVEAGWVGTAAADPKLFAVDFITHLETIYPDHYPLTPQDDVDVRHLGTGLEADLGRFLDETLILQHVDSLYALVAKEIDQRNLPDLIKNGVPIYPSLALGDRVAAAKIAALPRPTANKQRILILGAGMGGLSAAYELTNYAGWNELYDVTLYVLGWRVGGKTATGRGPAQRVEEHGIHILQGWYHNLFRVMAAVYEERAKNTTLPPMPWATWYDALLRNNSTFLTEYLPDLHRWVNNTMIFPETADLPGAGPPLPPWGVVKKMVGVVFEVLLGSPYAKGEGALAKWILDHFFPPDGGLTAAPSEPNVAERAISAVHAALERMHLAAHAAPSQSGPSMGPLEVGADVLVLLQKLLDRLASRLVAEDAHFRLIVESIEFAAVSLRGILGEVWNPVTKTFDWSKIDGEDFRAWLTKWGATDLVLGSPMVRFAYTGLFANLADGNGGGGLVSAGTSMQTMMEAGGYKRSFVWQLRSGTGDTMIMPLYDTLVARGVDFQFFRTVEQIHWSQGSIQSLTVGEQVTLSGPTYDPVIEVGNVRAWPSEPLYDQIDPAQAKLLQERGVDLENPWSDWAPVASSTLAVGRDYDQIVLAIPVGALPDCCGEIITNDPKWSAMVTGVRTTGTIGAQLWIKKSLGDLGLDLAEWGLSPNNCAPNAVTYESILYSWLDQSCVLPYERWTGTDLPVVAAYFTGTLDDPAVIPPFSDHDFPRRQVERVKGITEQWLQDNMRFFWPNATTREFPEGFDMSLLCHPTNPNATPAQRFDAQYFRANLSGTMRYTLSVPGSAAYRIRSDASGYSNLFLAGDWTDFGLNVGYIEGALISGLQAAQALRRRYYGQTNHRVIWTDPQSR
jgi:uncharacterized protein with NAD-binding domain and iron-sulfur cluster